MPVNAPGAAPQPDLSVRLKRISLAALEYLKARLDLLQFEWKRERQLVLSLLIHSLLAALFGMAALQFLGILIVAGFWETRWRLHAIGGVCLAFAIATAFMVRSVRAHSKRVMTPLAATVEETAHDVAALKKALP